MPEPNMANWVIEELQGNSANWDRVVKEIEITGKEIFPEYEFLNWSCEDQLRKSNSGLLYSQGEGEVAGYVLYSWPSSLSGFIIELAVKENYRRQGLGEALLKAAIEKNRKRNINRILLYVAPERTAAINLYEKLGFKGAAIIENLHSQDRNAHRMCLDFDKI